GLQRRGRAARTAARGAGPRGRLRARAPARAREEPRCAGLAARARDEVVGSRPRGRARAAGELSQPPAAGAARDPRAAAARLRGRGAGLTRRLSMHTTTTETFA